MAEENSEKTVEVELLASGMRVGDVDHVRGDVVRLLESDAERLEELGAVGPKGTTDKNDEEDADTAERAAREQRLLTGLEPVEGRRRPGRPRKTEAE